jgi:DnaJ-class molecular chaperone
MPADLPPNLNERLTAWRKVVAEADGEPRAGSDVERKVVLTLQEAYSGTTRLYTAITAAGQKRHAKLEIPPGVATDTKVRFTGYGLSGRAGGTPGDLYLLIKVQPCPGFERRGNDLYYQCEANLIELALGTEIRISTLNGRILAMTVPADTQPGQRFRLARQRMPQLGQPNQRGDLYVTVKMKLPAGLSRKQYALLRLLGWEASSAPNKTEREDPLIGHIFLAAILLLGIGVGFIIYWLLLD